VREERTTELVDRSMEYVAVERLEKPRVGARPRTCEVFGRAQDQALHERPAHAAVEMRGEGLEGVCVGGPREVEREETLQELVAELVASQDREGILGARETGIQLIDPRPQRRGLGKPFEHVDVTALDEDLMPRCCLRLGRDSDRCDCHNRHDDRRDSQLARSRLRIQTRSAHKWANKGAGNSGEPSPPSLGLAGHSSHPKDGRQYVPSH
jgi:hypothetical protein